MSIYYNNSPIAASGLVLLLDSTNPKSYPGTGTTWFDLSGNGNNGTLVNFAGPSAGTTSGFDTITKFMMFDRRLGGGDGTVNNRVVVANSASLTQSLITNLSGFTVSFWLKMTAVVCTAMTKWDGSWEIYYCNSLVFRTQGAGGNDGSTSLSSSTNLNNFHLITATHSGTERRFYINDTLFYTNANTVTSQTTTGPVSIGGYSDGQYATIGSIPYYSLYNRVLLPQEVQQNFNALRGRYNV